MTMPVNLILVRHGESEGNVANHRSRKSDDSCFTPEFMKRHSSDWRLTDNGRQQAEVAGQWIRDHFNEGHFDRYLVSSYVRARETAALLGLPTARWREEFILRERE